MDRYRVVLTPDASAFGILDREMYDYCGLPDEDGRPKRLTWKTREQAEEWLIRCYHAWKRWEDSREVTPPAGWRPKPPEPSPFDPGYQFYN
jgi:hypothetical protein